MERRISIQDNISLANYYAVELLEGLFGKSKPENAEILALESNLKKPSFTPHHITDGYLIKALIISSNHIEKNTLTLLLYNKNIAVDHICTKEDLFEQFAQKKHYDIVIVSDEFHAVGINFLVTYFHFSKRKNKPLLIYLGDDPGIDYHKLGFDLKLCPPFSTEDLANILPKSLL